MLVGLLLLEPCVSVRLRLRAACGLAFIAAFPYRMTDRPGVYEAQRSVWNTYIETLLGSRWRAVCVYHVLRARCL